jgi:predicted ATPase/DNA-binding winged helix-turn-helix (wHTH) protein
MIMLGQAQVFLQQRRVLRNDVMQPLGARAFDILELLLEARGQIISKDQILERVWPSTVVEENNLQVHISALRKALGCNKDIIRTIPGRGYLLIGAEEENLVSVSLIAPPRIDTNSTLIGRDALIEQTHEALNRHTLVTLIGCGGIGKTALALWVTSAIRESGARRVFQVMFADEQSPDGLIEKLAKAMDVEPGSVESVAQRLKERYAQEPLLVMLDNCEHLIGAVASLCELLFQTGLTLTILVTSREPLRIRNEYTIRLMPLETSEAGASLECIRACSATRLLIQRLTSLDPSFVPDDASLVLLSEVGRLVDGVPLALEMAAIRASALGLDILIDELTDRPHMLDASLRTAPGRQQSLAACIDWSYRLLRAEERTVLLMICRLEGQFSLDAVCEVASGLGFTHRQLMDSMMGLITKSLLLIVPQGPFHRYRLMRATRSFLLQQMHAPTGVISSRIVYS